MIRILATLGALAAAFLSVRKKVQCDVKPKPLTNNTETFAQKHPFE